MDEDVKKIMGYLSGKNAREVMFEFGPLMRLDTPSGGQLLTLNLNHAQEAARRGELRIALLGAFKLLSWFDYKNGKSVEYRVGSNVLEDKIYKLLEQSNKIEKRRLLNAYIKMNSVQSFMKNIPTGYYKQQFHGHAFEKEEQETFEETEQNRSEKTEPE